MIRSCGIESLIQKIFRHRKGMSRTGRRLESPLLTTAKTQLPANPLDPVNAHIYAIRL
jgi:hypothetical protein